MRLSIHILCIKYLEDRDFYFIKIFKYNNISFDCKIIEDEDSKEDDKKTVTDLEKKTSKKKAWHKAKKDTARALLVVAISELSIPMFTSIFVLGLFATITELSATMLELSTILLRLSTAILGISAIMSGLFTPTSISVYIRKLLVFIPLSIPASASVLIPGLFILVPLSAFALMPKLFFLFTSLYTLVFRSSFLLFLTLSLPKIPMPDLTAER